MSDARARRAFKLLASAAALLAAAFAFSLFISPYDVRDFADLKSSWRASDAWLLDRNGEPLSRVRVDHERRRGAWIAGTDVSPALVEMVLESEDKRFRAHSGVDWLAVPGAFAQTLSGGRRGGSTLTMQLAAYLNPELEASGRRSLVDKWRQMRQALAIERRWSKPQILEAWLNLMPFRGEVEGIDAASRVLFGKRAQGLDRVESALLAALVRSPNAGASRVARRACGLLKTGAPAAPSPLTPTREKSEARAEQDCLIAQGLAAGGLRGGRFERDIDGHAPHLAQKLVRRAGENVQSTLDMHLQQFAATTLQRHIRELRGRHVEDGALVVLDNETGEALAWIGSSGELSGAREVDGVLAPRQAGSTLKPFLYALAIERKLLTAASVLDDSPLAVTLPGGLYVPQNYDRAFKGQVSLRQALASSLNVPAVRTLALVGYDAFYRELKDFGFDLPRDADHYGYALALGGAEVTLLELANAYRALATGGRFDTVHTTTPFTLRQAQGDRTPSLGPSAKRPVADSVLRIAQKSVRAEGGAAAHSKHEQSPAIDSRAAFIVSDILADSAARALTFGLASPLATRYRASVKTGTSKDMRDNWAVGYAGRYTVGAWVGNFSGAPMHDVSGVDGAAPIWREVMDYLHENAGTYAQDLPSSRATAPAGVVRQRVAFARGLEPDRDEWFIEGTERARVVALPARAMRPHIESPSRGAIYAIDPDIPGDRQRLTITARGAPRGARLVLEDGSAARADKPLMWLPQPGRREVILKAADGRELDRVRFEVRGLARRALAPTPAAP